MSVTKEHIARAEHELELQSIREEVMLLKNDFNISAIGNLLSSLDEGISNLIQAVGKAQYYDSELTGSIKESIEKLAVELKAIREKEVKEVDFKPLENSFALLIEHNKKILSTISFSKPSVVDNKGVEEAVKDMSLTLKGKTNCWKKCSCLKLKCLQALSNLKIKCLKELVIK